MSFHWKKRPAAIVTKAPTEAPAEAVVVIPKDHVKVTRPEGATEEQLLNGYKGWLVKGDKGCEQCWGDEYVVIEGVVRYCPSCKFADRKMTLRPSSSHKMSES